METFLIVFLIVVIILFTIKSILNRSIGYYVVKKKGRQRKKGEVYDIYEIYFREKWNGRRMYINQTNDWLTAWSFCSDENKALEEKQE